MAMQDAFELINQVRTNPELRKNAYRCESGKAFEDYLLNLGYSFTPQEMENAVSVQSLKAEDEEEAGNIRDIGHWYSMLLHL